MDKSPAPVSAKETVDVQVNVKEGGLEISSYDGQFSFELGGRIMADAAWYNQDQVSLGDGTELRRARIEAQGVMFGDWGYELGVEFADGAEIKDAYVEYLGWPEKRLKAGQFKEPFSLEELTSSKYITFMERALPNAMAPGRYIGLGASTWGSNWSAAAGLFGEAFDADPDDEGDLDPAIKARLKQLLLNAENDREAAAVLRTYQSTSRFDGLTPELMQRIDKAQSTLETVQRHNQ